MPILRNITTGKLYYIAPDPTSQQIANALARNCDPYDRAGTLPYWDCSATDTVAAPATIHDEETMIGGTDERAQEIADNFCRDCIIVSIATETTEELLPLICQSIQKTGLNQLGILELYNLDTSYIPATRTIFELQKADLFCAIVQHTIPLYWQATDRNTPTTRVQGAAMKLEAQNWVNICAEQIGWGVFPYENAPSCVP